MDNRFYIIILLIAYILLKINRFWLNKNRYIIKEEFSSIKTYQNADEVLKSLSTSDSISLLASKSISKRGVLNIY